MAWRAIAICELFFADQVSNLDASKAGPCRMGCFEAINGFCDPFDEAINLFKYVVEIFDLADFNDPASSGEFQDAVDCLKASQIGSTLVDDNALGNAVGCDSFLEHLRAATRFRRSGSMKSSVWFLRSAA